MNTKTKYETIINSLIVLPKDEPIYSERATFITIDDEAAGPFIIIKQDIDVAGKGEIRIDVDEWQHIRKAADQMIAVCKSIGE